MTFCLLVDRCQRHVQDLIRLILMIQQPRLYSLLDTYSIIHLAFKKIRQQGCWRGIMATPLCCWQVACSHRLLHDAQSPVLLQSTRLPRQQTFYSKEYAMNFPVTSKQPVSEGMRDVTMGVLCSQNGQSLVYRGRWRKKAVSVKASPASFSPHTHTHAIATTS